MSSSLGFFASQISGHLYTLTGSYDALATVTVPSGGASSITFSAIPQTGYKHLQIRSIQSNSAGNYNGQWTFNGDTASNYSWHQLNGDGSSASASATPSTSWIGGSYMPASTSIFAGWVTDILDYSSTSKAKTLRTLGGYDANGSGYAIFRSGAWYNSSSAINSITITPSAGSFNQYSQFSLYGIK